MGREFSYVPYFTLREQYLCFFYHCHDIYRRGGVKACQDRFLPCLRDSSVDVSTSIQRCILSCL
jgi:hypothetical protein